MYTDTYVHNYVIVLKSSFTAKASVYFFLQTFNVAIHTEYAILQIHKYSK